MANLDLLLHADTWIGLATLTALEIVLGIDNIVFLTIMTGKLPAAQQPFARQLGLSLALIMRLGLLLTLSWVMSLKEPLLTLLTKSFSARDLILLGGGLFLIAKSTHEMFEKLEVPESAQGPKLRKVALSSVLLQIVLLDIIFSLDSVITAVGMARSVVVMAIAMVIAVAVMLVFAGSIGAFVNRHPSMKILALSFLLLVGVLLMAEGMGQHINKGYIYFAMAFALGVELINLRLRTRLTPAAMPPSEKGVS